ncbi:MAG: LapA family protein [Kiloniellaceae bacterium]
MLTLPVTVVVVVFAAANRDRVEIDLWPLENSVNPPLFVVILGSLLVGLLAGGMIVWLSANKARRDGRKAQRRAAELERDVARLRRDARAGAPGNEPGGAPGLPAAPEQSGERTSRPAAGA